MSIEHHEATLGDRAKMTAMRTMLAIAGKTEMIPESRPAADEMMAKIAAPDDVAFEPGEIDGIGGWWCRPVGAQPGEVILYLHGEGYLLGSAWAYRAFAGRIAKAAEAPSFVPDYALAPERPFPRGFNEARRVYDGLIAAGAGQVALCGDSAGGGLALALLLTLSDADKPPLGAAVMSPWIDLSLSGETMATKAKSDPLLSRETLAAAAQLYLAGSDGRDARANALGGSFAAAAPVRIDVGADEVLLDDALRFAALAETAGRECEAHVWDAMVHVFPRMTGSTLPNRRAGISAHSCAAGLLLRNQEV